MDGESGGRVIKWNVLGQARSPDGSALVLVEHDGEYVLRVNGRELMSTKRHASELRLGVLGCLSIANRPKARVLIGGLGLGFTLRGALATLGPDAEVVVAELMPQVVTWNKNPKFVGLATKELEDPRTKIVVDDVFAVLGSSGKYDAIMLDADNGTTAMMTAGNRALYEIRGLRTVHAALNERGVVVYWSAASEEAFEKLMKKEGFQTQTERVRAYGTGGPYHTLLLGRRS